MKTTLIILAGLTLLFLLANIAMAYLSKEQSSSTGLVDGKLAACPDSPNCVCSEAHSQSSEQHAIEPLRIKDATDWMQLRQRILSEGGTIQHEEPRYLHAHVRSTIFGYVDDVEFRLDTEQKRIHVRSASRIGRSDFGINRKRIEHVRAMMEKNKVGYR